MIDDPISDSLLVSPYTTHPFNVAALLALSRIYPPSFQQSIVRSSYNVNSRPPVSPVPRTDLPACPIDVAVPRPSYRY